MTLANSQTAVTTNANDDAARPVLSRTTAGAGQHTRSLTAWPLFGAPGGPVLSSLR